MSIASDNEPDTIRLMVQSRLEKDKFTEADFSKLINISPGKLKSFLDGKSGTGKSSAAYKSLVDFFAKQPIASNNSDIKEQPVVEKSETEMNVVFESDEITKSAEAAKVTAVQETGEDDYKRTADKVAEEAANGSTKTIPVEDTELRRSKRSKGTKQG
jgi:hypothetical protein